MGTPVVFDGIQPAAEIMEAHGAHRLPLDQAFTDPLGQSVSELDQARVPGWIGYVDQVTEQLKINSLRQSL